MVEPVQQISMYSKGARAEARASVTGVLRQREGGCCEHAGADGKIGLFISSTRKPDSHEKIVYAILQDESFGQTLISNVH